MTKASIQEPSLTQQAFNALHTDILTGRLKAGSRLRIETLRERYGIGPTPLREALARLSEVGFVDSEKNRGFSIPALTLADLRDITNQRKLIEISGLRQSIERRDDDYEAELVGAYYRLSLLDGDIRNHDTVRLNDWEDRHRAFHRALIRGADSPWLTRFQAVLYDQADRYRHQYIPATQLPEQVFSDHKLILDATLARDADNACALLERHIERVYTIGSTSGLFD